MGREGAVGGAGTEGSGFGGRVFVTINLAKPFKRAVQVAIEPGLEGADGAAMSVRSTIMVK